MKKILLPIALAVLCASCATVREARKIQNDESARLPGEYTVAAADSGLVFDAPVTLEQLEEIALRCNPSVLQARLQVDQAEIALKNARAGYMPTLGVSASHSRQTHNFDRHGPNTTRNTGSYSGGLNLSITVYDFGRTDAAVRQAQDSLAAALKNYEAARAGIVYNVRGAYFELKRAFDLHQVAQESVAQYKEHLDQVKLKHEVGAGLEYDVIKAEVDYNNALLNEITAANNIAIGWADLNQALGLAESPEYTLGDGKVREYTQTAEELMEIARAKEPELAALRYEIDRASAALDAAIAELYPNLTLSLGGNVSGHTPSLPWLWNLSGSLGLSQNLFNGGRTINAIRSNAIALQLARSRYAAREQTVYRNIRVAVLHAARARRSYEVACLTEKSAKQNLDIVNEKFKYGKASSVDRTDAQVSHSSARANAVTAHFDYQEAQAAIAKLLGE